MSHVESSFLGSRASYPHLVALGLVRADARGLASTRFGLATSSVAGVRSLFCSDLGDSLPRQTIRLIGPYDRSASEAQAPMRCPGRSRTRGRSTEARIPGGYGQAAVVRILVTGAAGFINGYLVPELLDAGHEVIGLDDFSKYGRLVKSYDGHARYRFVEGDAKDAGADRASSPPIATRSSPRRP